MHTVITFLALVGAMTLFAPQAALAAESTGIGPRIHCC
jgi:hypothetical protein